MTVESREDTEWAWITPRRLRVLAMLADDRTEQEIADELGLAYTTVRSHVEDLKRFTGQGSVSGYTWTSVFPVTSYVAIGNPSAGYHFDSWGLWIMWSCAFPYSSTSSFYYNQFSVTYGNPTTVYVPTWDFPCGQTFVRFGMCGNLLCGPIPQQMSLHSGYLEARIPSGSFYAVQHDWHY